ncbi:MAG: cytidine deaminase [Paraglaciecola sp.]|jgi:cytidine deaminase
MPKAPNSPKLPTDNKNTLLLIALAAQKNAYAPYSGFSVGSALLAEDMQTYAGCNVENAAYPLGQCAEAGAISAMILAGAKKIKEVLIASPNEDYCAPCGGCRQKIFEFCDQDTLVHLATSDGKVKTVTMLELLPLAFEL